MEHQPFEWTCPTCRKLVMTWTQKALRDEMEHHEYRHRKEEEELRRNSEVNETAMVVYEEKNYDILPLTVIDVGFLRTRHIKVDEQDMPNVKTAD